jgi:hypothetical protein
MGVHTRSVQLIYIQILTRCILRGHRKAISTLSINPDGRILLSGGELVFATSFVIHP